MNFKNKVLLQSVGSLFYQHFQNADQEKICLVEKSTSTEVTNGEFFQMTVTLAQELAQTGVGKGDVVTIISQNNIKCLVTVLGAFYIGAQVNLLSPDYLHAELKPLLAQTKPKIIFCTNKSLPQIQDLKLETKIINYSTVVFSAKKVEVVPVVVDLEEVALIMTSSGTTGLPKCVLLTHSNVASHLLNFYPCSFASIKAESTGLALLPFYHIYGMTAVLSEIFNGNRVVIMEKFIPDQFLATIQEYQIKELYVVPTILHFLCKNPLVEKYDLSSVREVHCGGTTLNEDTERAILKKLGLKSLRQGYGMTETTGGVTMVPFNEAKLGSIGKVCTGNEIRVCDVENGMVLQANQVGELRIRGSFVMKGYLGNDEAFDEDGFLKSGDLGYFDDEGYFFLVGRIKDLIKYKGFQVPPSEIENILFQHPVVEDCAVVGIPNDESGEIPLAFVVKRCNEDVSEEELVRYVDGRVSVQKRLKGGVRFVEEIPKSKNGKVLRNKLKKII